MSEFTVRLYQPGDEAGILDLFNRTFSEDNPGFVPRTPEYWRQLFERNPAGVQIMVAVDAQGRLIANYSSTPAFCSVRGEKRLCTQIVDTCVDKEWRRSLRKGSVFVTIGADFLRWFTTPGREPFDDFIYGLPNEKAFPVGTRVLGYKPVHVPLYALVHGIGTETAGFLASLSERAGNVTVEELRSDDWSEVARLFLAHKDEIQLGLWRDEAYLGWRYAPRPHEPYRTLLARRGGRLAGALVVRMGWFGHRVLPLVDWIGPGADVEAVAALLMGAGRIGVASGAGRLETWVTPNTLHHRTLTELGLRPEPTVFNLCIMVFSPDFDLEWAKANWFFTMGDSDIF
ncbi:MAG TPA: GNAT family N-acetyltransferase [Planctomycetota bacterium]|nr:GNAT family N-acetyltransferase [Planctomycetota bacterium]